MFLSFPVIIVQNHSSASSTHSIVFSWGTGSAPQSFLTLAGGGCHSARAAGFIILGSRCSLAGRGCTGKGTSREPRMSSSMIPANSIPLQQRRNHPSSPAAAQLHCWTSAPAPAWQPQWSHSREQQRPKWRGKPEVEPGSGDLEAGSELPSAGYPPGVNTATAHLMWGPSVREPWLKSGSRAKEGGPLMKASQQSYAGDPPQKLLPALFSLPALTSHLVWSCQPKS